MIEKEFSDVYVFDLRGDQRTSGEESRKEGGQIFGSGSRSKIAITLLIKNPSKKNGTCNIHYHDIGEYLSRDEKLALVKEMKSVSYEKMLWEKIVPNDNGDWVNQRNDNFNSLIPLESEKKFAISTHSFFVTHAIGIATNRDAWIYNFSSKLLTKNVESMIVFYNKQRVDFAKSKASEPNITLDNFIDTDAKKISWTRALKKSLDKNIKIDFAQNTLDTCMYRPYQKQKMYFEKMLIESPGLWKKLFPSASIKNLVIIGHGLGGNKPYSVQLFDSVVDLNCLEAGAQCFPLYYYEKQDKQSPSLFDAAGESEYIRRDGISDFIYEQAKKIYSSRVTKEDIFYYVYGILHSPEYRTEFANDLKKMLPRLPLVDEPNVFWKFSKAGRELAELHVNYENVEPHSDVKVEGAESKYYQVEKMRFPAKDKKDTIMFNSKITISNIPEEAYEYVVNGKSAIEWIMERYQVTVNKDSGIKNDPNDWADEVGNPRYILDLLLSIINVSVKTVEIVKGLPRLKF